MKFSSFICSAIAFFPTFVQVGVQGHGYMYEPPTRNYVANSIGLVYGSQPGVPPKEYCHHCLNQNAGVCGITQDGTTDYDLWLDSTGVPMPFVSQRTYQPGQIIEVRSTLTANHAGHSELRGCPIKDGETVNQACFDGYTFEFIADDLYNMPKDPNYPERGYFYGGQGANGFDFSMKFRVPDNLVGQKVMLQWQYITANSCSPPGYPEYFGGQNSQNKVLSDHLWTSGLGECALPYPSDGSTGALAPERFWNCAEVSILGEGVPPVPTTPTRAPTRPTRVPTAPSTPPPITPPTRAPAAVPSKAPQSTPTPNPTESPNVAQCRNEWDSCFDDQNSCCEENYCEAFQWYARCRRKTDIAPPTGAPAAVPSKAPQSTPPPTPSPTESPNVAQCRNEWDSCFDDQNSCCEENYCEAFQWYARCRRRPDACLLEWNPCNDDPSACCEGLVCKGDGWMMCQLP